MPQLHFYVPDQVADELKVLAEAAGLSTSKYVANLVQHQLKSEWPEGYFDEVFGGWEGEPLERAPQGTFESRDPLGTVEAG